MLLRARLALAASLSLVLALTGFSARADDLKDFLTDLYGGGGIFLPPAPGIPQNIADAHTPHFTGETQIAELAALSDGILSGAGIFALNSTVTGVAFDLSTGVPQTVQDSLGPLLTERGPTLGEGRWTLGFGYTSQRFKQLDGDDISDLAVTFTHQDCCAVGPPPIPPPDGQFTGFEEDTITLDIDLTLNQDVFAIFSNYGLTNNFDVGVVVPIVRLEAKASSFATINPANPGAGSDINGNPVHSFVNDPSLAFDETGGTKTGIGDVVLRSKWNFMEDVNSFADMAVLFDWTLPTGDEDDLLGTGEHQFRLVYIASKNLGRITPHLNVGYSAATHNSTLEKLSYAVGFDARVTQKLTLAADVLGRYNPNVESIGNNIVDFAVEAKWNPWNNRNIPLNAFVSVPLNDDGLRADVIWGVGFDFIL